MPQPQDGERKMPRDANKNPFPLTKDVDALAQTYNASLTTTTVEVTLDVSATVIEVQALGIDIALKYGTSDVTTSNFDEFIQDGHVRHYVLPLDTTAINVIAASGTGTVIIIEK